MYNEVVEKFLDFNVETKDEAWATELVRQIILNAKPIIRKTEYENNEKVLFGEFDQTDLNKIFTGKTMARLKTKLSDSNVVFFERVRNALIADRDQAGFTITVNSLDPEKSMKKKSDKELLANRKGIEALMNEFTANNGMPPKTFGKDDYNGNVEEFDEKEYDELDSTDLNDFFDNHWGLKAEIELSKCINPIIRENQVTRNFDKYIMSILNCLYTCSQVYVDQVDGAIKVEYYYPYEIEALHSGDDNDLKKAQAFNKRSSTNIRGFMRKFGTKFDFANDWNILMNAAYGPVDGSQFTGITENDNVVYGAPGKTVDFKNLMDMPIVYGYAEFKTINKKTKQSVTTPFGNSIKQEINSQNPPVNGAKTESKFSEDTYYAYYLETGAINPKLIKWGRLYMQNYAGLNDEYSGFSILVNRRKGTPVATILKPFHHLIQVSFKMTEMLINDVKPDGVIMNYSSILKVAEYLKENSKDATDAQMTGIEMFLRMVEESPNLLADTPETEEGDAVGGGNLGMQTKKNGLNEAANDLIKIIDWIELKVEKYLGTQGIDLTDQNAGYKLSIENKKRARSATAFIDFILLNHLEDMSIVILNYIQDISKFKDIPAYKYLESLIGTQALEFIASMDKAPHRYGIFMDTFNNDIELMEIRGLAEDARRKEEITIEQYTALRSFESPKQAMAYLAREKKKAYQQKQKDQLTLIQQQDAINEKEFQRKVQLENIKGQWMERARGQEKEGFVTAAQINTQGNITTEQMKQEGQNKRLATTAIDDINKIAENANAEAQRSAI